VLDNLTSGRRDNLTHVIDQIELVEGDIRDPDLVRRVMRGVEYVLHHAALVSVPQSMTDPAATHEVNVTGTLNVLVAAREAGVERVVLASSSAVYGDNGDLPLNETAGPRPLSPYAASKLAAEVYCQMFFAAYGLPTVALRYFNVYGPRQNPSGDYAAVIPKFIEQIKAGSPPVIYGDGKQTRDFLHVSDVVCANLVACECSKVVGQVINVASGQIVSLLELVDTLNGLLGTQFSPQFELERAGDIYHSAGDASRMAELMGLRVQVPLAEGLAQLLNGAC
jgi:nucleoside-diphosphate-sugar epimerase